MWPNPQKTEDLVTFTEEILNGKLHFLCRKLRIWSLLLKKSLMENFIFCAVLAFSYSWLAIHWEGIFDCFIKKGTSVSSSTSSTEPKRHNPYLNEYFSIPRFLGVKASGDNIRMFCKTFNVNSRLFICLGLGIIKYVQRSRTPKAPNMKSFAIIINE